MAEWSAGSNRIAEREYLAGVEGIKCLLNSYRLSGRVSNPFWLTRGTTINENKIKITTINTFTTNAMTGTKVYRIPEPLAESDEDTLIAFSY